MHDTELIDNCFFTSKEKVSAHAQTMQIDERLVIDRAVSAKTLITNAARDKKSSYTSIDPLSH
jgi:hypothetical protein